MVRILFPMNKTYAEIENYLESQKENILDFLKKIVSLESPSTDKQAVNKCSSLVTQELEKTGVEITRFPQEKVGDIYLARLFSPHQEKGFILVLTHIDTVWPVGQIKKMPFLIRQDKIYGPGVLDMKAGLAMILFSVKAIKKFNLKPRNNIFFFINSSEEISSEESFKIIQEWAQKACFVFCLEPSLPGGSLKIERKGRLVVKMETKGKAAHAGNPEMGINAIDELILQLEKIKKIQRQGVTLNTGVIKGGQKTNIVAPSASAYLDIRFWKNQQKENILKFLLQMQPILPGASFQWEEVSLTPPMEKTRDSLKLFSRVKKIASSLDITLKAGKSGGGSDASIASNLGIPTLDGLGPEGEGIHSENEYVQFSSLLQRTLLLTKILCEV